MNKIVGKIDEKVIRLLNLPYEKNEPIMLGKSNIEHMKRQHLEDFKKYGKDIEDIIKKPTYVARNPNQDSIEYIKEYKYNDDFVLVAVRITNKGKFFARTLFTMTEKKKNIYLRKGYAKKYE